MHDCVVILQKRFPGPLAHGLETILYDRSSLGGVDGWSQEQIESCPSERCIEC